MPPRYAAISLDNDGTLGGGSTYTLTFMIAEQKGCSFTGSEEWFDEEGAQEGKLDLAGLVRPDGKSFTIVLLDGEHFSQAEGTIDDDGIMHWRFVGHGPGFVFAFDADLMAGDAARRGVGSFLDARRGSGWSSARAGETPSSGSGGPGQRRLRRRVGHLEDGRRARLPRGVS